MTIMDIIMMILFVALLFFIVGGFNKEQARKYEERLALEAQRIKENEDKKQKEQDAIASKIYKEKKA